MQGAKWHSGLVGVLFVCLNVVAYGQEPSVTLTSREKLVQVGRPFEVELSVRHPERMIVVFPDTSTEFRPYEVHVGKPIPTSTNDGISEDVKIYKLYTWEIDSLQHLQFPVHYLTAKGDTQTVMSNVVDVEFQGVIPSYSDSLQLKAVADLAVIDEPVNWFAWGIIFTVLALIVVVAVLVFSKPIRKMLRRAKIEREWRKYLGQLKGLTGKIEDQPTYYGGLNKVWRGYFDRNWTLALGSKTTTELAAALETLQTLDPEDKATLLKVSRSTDMVLYAGIPQTQDEAERLKELVRIIMTKEYLRRKEAVEL